MPSLSISWDIRDLMSSADRLDVNKNLPEYIAKTVVVSLRDLAETNARKNLGNGRFSGEIAAGIRANADSMNITVDHASNDTNHLAEHVEVGGPVRSSNEIVVLPGRSYFIFGERIHVLFPCFEPSKDAFFWIFLQKSLDFLTDSGYINFS